MKRTSKALISALLLGLFAAPASAYNLTGTVAGFFTQDYPGAANYTFVNINTGSGNGIAYYVGDNTAVATVIDNARRHGATISITANSGGLITTVR